MKIYLFVCLLYSVCLSIHLSVCLSFHLSIHLSVHPSVHLFRSHSKQEIAHPLHVVERYIELLCRYEPVQVYMFLKSSDNYRLEEALEVRNSVTTDWKRL